MTVAVYLDRAAFQARDVLGVAPHRLMTANRTAEALDMMRINRFLSALREAGRRSVFMVDNKCGDGSLLLRAARRARALGFVAIDAKGFDRSPQRIALARAAALAWRDPAVGIGFFVRDSGSPLPVEENEADLMLAAPDEDEPDEIERVADPKGLVVNHR
jgi:hypothetical protein